MAPVGGWGAFELLPRIYPTHDPLRVSRQQHGTYGGDVQTLPSLSHRHHLEFLMLLHHAQEPIVSFVSSADYEPGEWPVPFSSETVRRVVVE